ncbi:MAG TPA: hypothetical protein VFH80_07690, partial [Solirubrobacteraceae bacterium]|nr:hypothetical protein [Solirubrobacteraceae bacterium]
FIEPGLLCCLEKERPWVDVAAKRATPKPHPSVHARESEADPPAVARERHRQRSFRMVGRSVQEPWSVRVAADDAVHDYDGGPWSEVWCDDEIADSALHLGIEAALRDQFAGRRFVAFDELDVGRAGRAGGDELDLQGADSPADLQHSGLG